MKSDRVDYFLRSVERRAFAMTMLSVRNRDEALDVVQEAMISFSKNYSSKRDDEFAPLFYKTLRRKIIDWSRKEKLRKFFGFCDTVAPLCTDKVVGGDDPFDLVSCDESVASVYSSLGSLPEKQREAFLLRAWEGLDVKQAAVAMGCSEGSVKTHFFRAVNKLKSSLGGDFYEEE